MQVKDLIVTGDARIVGNLYTKDGKVGAGGGGGGSDGSSLTYKLTKSGSTITLTGSDGSTSSVTDANTTTSVDLSGYVPTSRTVNGKALTGNITLSAGDVGAAASSHTHSYAASSHTHDDRYFTESEINSKLSGYSTTSHTHSGYAAASHSHNYLPATKADASSYPASGNDVWLVGGKPISTYHYFGNYYQTLEVFAGKPVYVVSYDLGALPNNTSKSYSLPSGITNIVDFRAFAKKNGVYAPLPWFTDSGGIYAKAGITASSNTFYIKTFGNVSDYSGYVIIKYTL